MSINNDKHTNKIAGHCRNVLVVSVPLDINLSQFVLLSDQNMQDWRNKTRNNSPIFMLGTFFHMASSTYSIALSLTQSYMYSTSQKKRLN